jgi:hypothetical protein
VFALIAFTFALLSRMGEIIDIQRRIREVGRIRLGVQGTTAEGKRYPKKINRFRFTSGDEAIINATAQRYGGTARGWQNDDRDEFEVVSDATEIPIMLPPNPTDLGFSQWFEVWGNKVWRPCRARAARPAPRLSGPRATAPCATGRPPPWTWAKAAPSATSPWPASP